MGDGGRRRAIYRLVLILTLLAAVAGFVSTLGDAAKESPFIPLIVWATVAVIWVWLALRGRRSSDALWLLPSALFRYSLVAGSAVVVTAHLPTVRAAFAGSQVDRALILTALDISLYELGVLALASLAAFAISRSLLRPYVIGTRPPVGARDLTVRTRFVVGTTGAAFATAGTLLSLLLDFSTATDTMLAGFLMTAIALVAFAALIGWLVGDDAASSIEAVTKRMRALGTGELPIVAADEVGDLALAANELERRIRREEADAAARAERARVARELHDGVAKSVSVLALEAASVERDADHATRAKLGRIEHLARGLAEELRAIVRDMRTQEERQPFGDAIDRLVAEHPGTVLELSGDLDRVNVLARFETLRILEEALRNADQHARARRVTARVSVADEKLRLVVEDDGKGIDEVPLESLAERGHFGLIGMRERAALMDGDLRFERRVEGGTRVILEAPMEKETT